MGEFIGKGGQVRGVNGNGKGLSKDIIDAAAKWAVFINFLTILGGFVMAFNFMQQFATKDDLSPLATKADLAAVTETLKEVKDEQKKRAPIVYSIETDMTNLKKAVDGNKNDIKELNASFNRHIYDHAKRKYSE